MQNLKPLFAGLAATAMLATGGVAVSAERVQVLTAPTGSIVHTTGSAIASVLSNNTDMTALAIDGAGPQVFVPRINQGQAEFTLLNAADAYQAFRGGQGYNQAFKNLRLASVGFTNTVGSLVRADSDIRTPEDIKGKRVSGVFSAHKTCKTLADVQMANWGLTWDDVEVVPVTHSKTSVTALGDGRVDVSLCAALGAGVNQEVNARTPVRFISLSDDPQAVERGREVMPAGGPVRYETGHATGVTEPVLLWNYPFYFVASADASDDVVYKAVKAIYENIDELREISGVFNRWKLEGMVSEDLNLPVHPGAQRFYEEQGMWTDAVQAEHDRNMEAAR